MERARMLVALLVVVSCHPLLSTAEVERKTADSQISKDTLEGETIRLECRFNSMLMDVDGNKYILYWHRRNHHNTEPVAINDTPLESDYELDFSMREGKYDLIIKKAQYDRDDGHFECKVKEAGSGLEIKSRSYTVTILIPPGPPIISPSHPIAKEGELFRLSCASEGGSPDPVIEWYRDGVLLEGKISPGGQRNKPTVNTLEIDPSIDYDKAIYKCTVWNRATREERKLESLVELTVHYKPRIHVGPFNPLSISNDGNAEMTCTAEANPPVRSIRWMKNGQILSNSANHTILRVKPDDSGFYDCVADNGVGVSPPKESLQLNVLYGPYISMVPFAETSTGETINVKCNIESNPKPHTIIWLKEGDQLFKKSGPILSLSNVQPEDAGNYVCTATTTIKPSGVLTGIERMGNATVKVQVKHKPGKTEITPANPVAVAGRPFTMMCGASPPGYPSADYRWWREGQENNELGKRANMSFVTTHVSQEGRYFCQAFNSIGKASVGSVYLTVNEAAQVTIAMKPQFIVREGDTNFKLTCIGRAKPRPTIVWTHNDVEINPESGEYRIENKEQNEDADVKTVQSTLYFEAMARKGANSLTANDRGVYACHYGNGLATAAKSETTLRVEHTPVVRHTYNRVAFDVGETALLQCKMSAYPAPKFEWFFSGKMLDSYLNDRYNTNVTELADDIHVGSLAIKNARESDYGDYTCRAFNAVGDDDEKTIIKLVKKSAPETPVSLEVMEVVADSVTLRWTEGFNGGFANTEFVVNYFDGEKYRNESCRAINPCKVTGLESRREYHFRVLAVNPRGFSSYSDSLKVATKVNLKDMPSAFDSSYDRERNNLIFKVESQDVALRLVAKIEVRTDTHDQWSALTTVQVLSDLENVYLKSTPDQITDIRVILCLQSNDSWCGYEHLVKMDSTYPREAKAAATDHLYSVIAISTLCAILAMGIIFCCCIKNKKDKEEKKDFESDTSNERSNKPLAPNYFSSHDNKGLMSEMENANLNKLTSGIYGSAMNTMNGHIPQNYYLTGDGNSDPSPNGSNETQTEFWNTLKSANMMHDMHDAADMAGYGNGQAGANHYNMMATPANGHHLLDPNGFINAYGYYPTQSYQQLEDERKTMNMGGGYYDEMNGNAYGASQHPAAMGMDMLGMPTTESMKHAQLSYNSSLGPAPNDDGYGSNRARVMSEIIV